MPSSEAPGPDRPPRRWLAWTLFGVSVAGCAVLIVIVTVGGVRMHHSFAWILNQMAFVVPAAAFSVVGLLVALRKPGNTAGWIMLVIGLLWGLIWVSFFTPALPYLTGFLWVLPFGLMGTHLLLRIPDGRLPSPRWRWVSRASTTGIVLAGTFLPSEDVDPTPPTSVIGLAGLLMLLVCIILSVASLVVRARRAGPDERRQIRWVATGAATFFGFYLLSFVPGMLGFQVDLNGATLLAYAAIPTGIGIAILKYRLYDIDVVIRKALVVAALAVFFTLVYAFVVGGVGALVGASSTTGLSFAAAAVVALGFQPVLARARRFADRAVYGKRATPYEVLARFSERVGETYADEDVLRDMARIVAEGVGAEHAAVWIKIEEHLRVAARWPALDTGVPEPVTVADTLAEIPDAHAVFRIEHQGELLGVLSVTTPPRDPMDPAKTRLVSDLASQAGLVLRNVHLNATLRARLTDLQAAQKRLVTAQDEERRKLERNIHDGAQQQLVAIAVKARLAGQLTEKDPAKAIAMVEQIEDETKRALEDLRDLARGIYPPLLADQGLVAALESQARKSPVATTVVGDGIGRFDQDVEAAVYFSCLEALQNVAKYARASVATVHLSNGNGDLTFEVRDDGVGFDPEVKGSGSGLEGMSDRLGALGGAVEVRSAPGNGTTVIGKLPTTVAGTAPAEAPP